MTIKSGFVGGYCQPATMGVTDVKSAVAMGLLDLRETPDTLSLLQDHAIYVADPVVEPDLTIGL